MTIKRGAAHVHVDHNTLELVDADPSGHEPRSATRDGLVTYAPGTTHIVVGTQMGSPLVTIEVSTVPPVEVDMDAWDEIVEFSQTTFMGEVVIFDSVVGTRRDLPSLILEPGSSFRVRCHARGRDEACRPAVNHSPEDSYLIQMWPAPTAPEKIHKLTDDFGKRDRASFH
ncbi:hypothetical protein ACIBSV_45790 [Embleya sp. NPDC050154]|uniref:hypothetical protein n=1 Tax=Embleya sp. NPDC050154 TaxID=3363988 RepID=UPI00379F9F73